MNLYLIVLILAVFSLYLGLNNLVYLNLMHTILKTYIYTIVLYNKITLNLTDDRMSYLKFFYEGAYTFLEFDLRPFSSNPVLRTNIKL